MSVIHHQLNMTLPELAINVDDISVILFDCSIEMDCSFLI